MIVNILRFTLSIKALLTTLIRFATENKSAIHIVPLLFAFFRVILIRVILIDVILELIVSFVKCTFNQLPDRFFSHDFCFIDIIVKLLVQTLAKLSCSGSKPSQTFLQQLIVKVAH